MSQLWWGAGCPPQADRERGGKRFAAFVLGFPITLISMFVAPHTRRLRLPKKNEAQAEHDLLLEIRRDRALRDGQGPASGQEDVAAGVMPPE